MADMPTDFWSGWIAVITLLSLVALAWVVYSVYFSTNDHQEAESPLWDETLTEGSNPAPMWWFWLIFAALIVSVVYLMLYPGLGSYSGALKWSQGGRLEQSRAQYRAEFGAERQRIAATPMAELQNDSVAMSSARRLFDQNCSACHGPNGYGQAATFPNLIDDDWQWGGSDEQIEHSIRQGRQAIMVGWKAAVGDEGVQQLTKYVRALAAGNAAEVAAPGEALFGQYCVACHGPTGTGVTALGGPNLSDDIWLYGGSDAAVAATISDGRSGIMPAFEQRLDDTEIRLLVAWLTQQNSGDSLLK